MSDEVMTREEETGEDGEVGAEVQDAPTEASPPTPPGLQVWQVWGRLEDTNGHLVLVASQDGRAVSIRSIAGALGTEGDMITLTPEGASAAIEALAAHLYAFEAQGGTVQA